MNNKYIDNKLQVFDDRFVITNPRNEEDEGWLTGVLPLEVKQFIKEALVSAYEQGFKTGLYTEPEEVTELDKLKSEQEALSQVRNETIEEVRLSLWGGATRDEVHKRLDELKANKEEEQALSTTQPTTVKSSVKEVRKRSYQGNDIK